MLVKLLDRATRGLQTSSSVPRMLLQQQPSRLQQAAGLCRASRPPACVCRSIGRHTPSHATAISSTTRRSITSSSQRGLFHGRALSTTAAAAVSSSLESTDISYEDIVQSSSPPLEGKCAVQRSVYCTSGRPTNGMCRLYECVADRVLACVSWELLCNMQRRCCCLPRRRSTGLSCWTPTSC